MNVMLTDEPSAAKTAHSLSQELTGMETGITTLQKRPYAIPATAGVVLRGEFMLKESGVNRVSTGKEGEHA